MKYFSSKNIKYIFFAVLLLAFVLRFVNLSAPDILTDEVFYAVRGIGFLDYTGSPNQETPLDWFDPPPAWSHLSFHDHPPGIFLIQYIFFFIFGDNLFASRLPFVLFGLLSIFLIYLIGRRLMNERAGIIAAALTAVLSAPVWLSRTGIMEAIVVFVMLLIWYLFLKTLEDKKWLWWWGASLGFAFLIKYTTFILLPVFLIYLLIFQRDLFKERRLYLSLLLALVVFSPVIIFNINLYQATGHFDLQFSYLLGQNTPEWLAPPGKPLGTYQDRFLGIGQNMTQVFSPISLGIFIASFIYLIWFLARRKEKILFWLMIFFVMLVLLMLLVGPFPRFLMMFIPFVILSISYLVDKLLSAKFKYLRISLICLAGLFFLYELFYSINSNWLLQAKGQPQWFYSTIRPSIQDAGINQLNKFIDKELEGKASAFVPKTKSNYLNGFIEKRAERYRQGKELRPFFFIYDFNLHQFITLWTFDRRFLYRGIPFAQATDFWGLAKAKGNDVFKGLDLYYITGTQDTLWRDKNLQNNDGEKLEKMLILQKVEPQIISNSVGTPMFKVYRFHL